MFLYGKIGVCFGFLWFVSWLLSKVSSVCLFVEHSGGCRSVKQNEREYKKKVHKNREKEGKKKRTLSEFRV